MDEAYLHDSDLTGPGTSVSLLRSVTLARCPSHRPQVVSAPRRMCGDVPRSKVRIVSSGGLVPSSPQGTTLYTDLSE